MTESLQWSDKNSEVANIKNASMINYKEGWNIVLKDSLGKEIGDIMNNHIEIFRIKEYSNQTKNSVDGLISRMERTEERVSEPENRTLEITQSEQQ